MSLYKYVIAPRLDVLQHGMIRFTQPHALNDPFELRPFFESTVPKSFVRDHVDDASSNIWEIAYITPAQRALVPYELLASLARSADREDADRIFRSQVEAMVSTFSKAMDEFTPKAREMFRENFGAKLGVLSLSEVPDSELM
jgi:hypothetical protein